MVRFGYRCAQRYFAKHKRVQFIETSKGSGGAEEMKLLSLILLCLLSVGAWGQTQIFEQRIAPRADSLTGDWSPSDSGKYMISFPYPNDCLELGPIQANSRSMALYRAFSRGGFTLKHSDAGLTVWTLEEWNDLKKETWYADYEKRHAEHCAKK